MIALIYLLGFTCIGGFVTLVGECVGQYIGESIAARLPKPKENKDQL